MDETKPWYLSRTIWASVVTVAMAGAGLLGVAVEGTDGAALADHLLLAATGVSGVVAIVGRLAAKQRIR